MQQILSLLRQFFFWLIFFAIQRAIFLAYYFKLIIAENIPITDVFKTFYFALKLDISAVSYILLLPFFLLLFQLIVKSKWSDIANKIYTSLIILTSAVITSGELGIYGEWKTKLSDKALQYLRNPDEVINSIETQRLVFLLILILVQVIIFLLIYQFFIYKPVNFNKKEHSIWKISFAILVPFFLFIGIRGGFQAIPITTSQAYFSQYNILNLAAVNSDYNLVFSIRDSKKFESKNVFKTLPDEEAEAIVNQLHAITTDTTVSVLNISRPNIVVILIESWSGDLIESLGGNAGITPEFKKLEKEGILFTNFYATANRSQQAMASLYSGLPGYPVTTLADHPEKYNSVPSLIKILNKEGYYTSFYFGGQLIYGNIRSLLISHEFNKLVEGADFNDKIPRGKLGVHDEYLFDRFLTDLNSMPQPFFATAFTLSSHSPYDQPGERQITWVKLEKDFVNSAHYTDRCLGEFMAASKRQSWYDQTLFVIMSDHSHNSYKNFPLESFEYHHIPMLICGGALKDEFRGKQLDIICSNVDVTSTLLNQLNLNTDLFKWSKNLFNPYANRFAYFELNEGFGWKTNEGEQVVLLAFDTIKYSDVSKEKEEKFSKEGRAYIQVLLDEFLGY